MTRILVVEDEPGIAMALEDDFRSEGYEVEVIGDGEAAGRRVREQSFDVIVLDLMLPRKDGFEVCRELRRAGVRTPVIMLTAKTQETEKVLGLELGADDYVTKPYSTRLLLERIRALERRRRTRAVSDADVVALSGVMVDRRRHQASVAGRVLNLTRSEFRLLETLIRQPGRAFGRTELINAALGEDTIVMERTIDVHIRAIRSKLDESADLIETVRGVGYRFRDPNSSGQFASESDEE